MKAQIKPWPPRWERQSDRSKRVLRVLTALTDTENFSSRVNRAFVSLSWTICFENNFLEFKPFMVELEKKKKDAGLCPYLFEACIISPYLYE